MIHIPAKHRRAIFACFLVVVAAVFGRLEMWAEFGMALVFALYLASSSFVENECRRLTEKMERLEKLLTEILNS